MLAYSEMGHRRGRFIGLFGQYSSVSVRPCDDQERIHPISGTLSRSLFRRMSKEKHVGGVPLLDDKAALYQNQPTVGIIERERTILNRFVDMYLQATSSSVGAGNS